MNKKEPMIIMTSSGFMQQGRVVAYVKQLNAYINVSNKEVRKYLYR